MLKTALITRISPPYSSKSGFTASFSQSCFDNVLNSWQVMIRHWRLRSSIRTGQWQSSLWLLSNFQPKISVGSMGLVHRVFLSLFPLFHCRNEKTKSEM